MFHVVSIELPFVLPQAYHRLHRNTFLKTHSRCSIFRPPIFCQVASENRVDIFILVSIGSSTIEMWVFQCFSF